MSNEQLFEIGYQFLSQKNYQAALPYLHKAAIKGHMMAHLWLESLYVHGYEASSDQ